MLLRNFNPPELCNSIRLRVQVPYRNVIEFTVLTGSAKGEYEFLQEYHLYIKYGGILGINSIAMILKRFDFERLPFPLKVCFAITINKIPGISNEQTLRLAEKDLREICFSHVKFCGACSRVGSPRNLVICFTELQMYFMKKFLSSL